MKNSDIHRNCTCYAPVDAAKGICHKTKEPVSADAGCCAMFVRAPKCGGCRHYRVGAENPYMGLCSAEKEEFFAYADVSAATCRNYRE